MNTMRNTRNRKEKYYYLIAALFLVAGYILLNRSINASNEKIIKEVTSNNKYLIKSERILSFSQNSTILNAFKELDKGYQNLSSQNKLKAGFAMNIQAESSKSLSLDDPKSIYYVQAIRKYHHFFNAYIKNLELKNIYLIEPESNIILYSGDLGEGLLKSHPSPYINTMINKVKNSHQNRNMIQGKLPDNNDILICSAVHEQGKLIGIIAAIFPGEE